MNACNRRPIAGPASTPGVDPRNGRRRARALACGLAALLTGAAAPAQTTMPAGTWAASADLVAAAASGQSVRNVFRTSVGGTGVQLQLSNVFGDRDVTFNNITLGVQSRGASLVADSVSTVTFNGGQTTVTVPRGQRLLSDVMPRTLPPRTKLAVSMHMPGATGAMTGHPYGAEDVYFSATNVNAAGSTDGSLFPYVGGFKVFVEAVYIKAANAGGTIAAIGDSITDGYDSGYGQSTRWTDRLADRLIAAGTPMGVMNEGISSNTVTVDKAPGGGGQSAQTRLNRDVLAIQGLTTVIVFEGINDFFAGANAAAIKAGLKNLADRIRAAGKCAVGGTILPAGNLTAAQDIDRKDVNNWIRTSGAFDSVADFDLALRNPANPSRLLAAYDNGDTLHPNQAGNQAMADAIDLNSVRCIGSSTTPGQNLAQGKIATQSSVGFGGAASRAVDGSTDGNYFNNSVSHSAGASQDWWQVDLGQSASIDSVKLWNRTDCCGARLSNFHVFVSAGDMTGRTWAQLTADPAVRQVAATSLNGAASLSLALAGATGRYVRVQLDAQDYLSLAEVQVFGRAVGNVAQGKPASQSSVGFGGAASRAVDGSTNGSYFNGSVSHTAGAAAQEWWQVDLGKVHALDSVDVWNRTDCCADRLVDFYVLASSTDMTGRTLSQLLADTGVKQVRIGSLNGAASLSVAMAGASGRYVRIQLAGTGFLSLAEVQVFGR